MEKLGQIPMRELSDREIILLSYQQLQTVSETFQDYRRANDKQLHEVDQRLDKIENRMQENDILKKQIDTQNARLIKFVALGFTGVQIIITIVFYFINKK